MVRHFSSEPNVVEAATPHDTGGNPCIRFGYFRLLVVRGMLEARRHQEKLLLSVRATFIGVGGQLPCFRAGEQTIEAMEQRFRNDLSPQQFAKFAGRLVNESLDHWSTRTYDCYQKCCMGIH